MSARILLIEDDEINRDLLSRRLLRRGYEVLAAEDGETGLEVVERERPDLILMDINMPGMDGYEATRLLKSASATRSIPVIALTAYAMAGDRERTLAAGCDDYDTKPIELPRLLAKMEALLTGEGTEVEPG